MNIICKKFSIKNSLWTFNCPIPIYYSYFEGIVNKHHQVGVPRGRGGRLGVHSVETPGVTPHRPALHRPGHPQVLPLLGPHHVVLVEAVSAL